MVIKLESTKKKNCIVKIEPIKKQSFSVNPLCHRKNESLQIFNNNNNNVDTQPIQKFGLK